MVVFQFRDDAQKILLIKRKHEPFKNHWALPGGFLDMDETLEQAADRELKEETGLIATSRRQIGAFSALDRDPRERVITIAFRMTVANDAVPVAADDASDARWFAINELPELAFDHWAIIESALVQ